MEIAVPALSGEPKLERFLTMKAEGKVEEEMARVSDFIQRTPKDGEPSTQRTDVYLGHDDKNLYAVFVAFDSDPDKVRAHMSRRETAVNDDQVEIMLDTFHDQRRAYAFVTNPLGVQWDALWTEGDGFDQSFDTVWHSRGVLTDQGYVVLMAIPFKSLRFPSAPEQKWGVILLREIQRGNFEQTFWPHISSTIEGRLNQAGTLLIKKSISPGRNMQFIPYATYRTFRALEPSGPAGPRFISDGADPDAGVDAKIVIQDNMALDLTGNPDFSQVESDEPQLTVNQRFEVFFPEKRPFFLENSNFFTSPINLVFTRRIADPQFGIRLTGKSGPYAIGTMLMDDEAPGSRIQPGDAAHGKRAFFGVARVSRDILNQSNIGFTYTGREFEGEYNHVAGIDTRLKLDQNWDARTQAVFSSTDPGNASTFTGGAYTLSLNRSGRQLNTHTHFQTFDSDFATFTGFVPRRDIRDFHNNISYSFRPERKFLIRWGPEFFVQGIWDNDGTRLDEIIEGSLEWEFTGQTLFEVNYRSQRERLRPRDFGILTQPRDFDTDFWEIEYRTRVLDELNIDGTFAWGRAINFEPRPGGEPHVADMIDSNLQLAVQPLQQLRIDNRYIFFKLSDRNTGKKILTNQILRSRWNYQFDRKLSVRLILQYDVTTANPLLTSLETTKNFNVDFLITYLVNPWTAIFAGINSNYQNLDLVGGDQFRRLVRTRTDFLNDSRQFFVKYSYLFRF